MFLNLTLTIAILNAESKFPYFSMDCILRVVQLSERDGQVTHKVINIKTKDSNITLPTLFCAQYLLDFGYIVKGLVRTRKLRVANVSSQMVRI